MNKIFYDMEDYKEKYEMGLEGLQEILSTGEDSVKMSILQLRLEGIFPELKESEDEKIRKVLIDYFDRANKVDENPLIQYGIHTDKILAWLEKQGEQKSTDNLTPQEAMDIAVAKCFDEHKLPIEKLLSEIKTPEESLGIDSDTYSKIVDECVYGEQKCVNNVKPKFHKGNWVTNGIDCTFQIASIEDGIYYDTNNCGSDIKSTDKSYHLWTIKDAKDGDVLASDNGVIILVKESRDSSFGYRLSYHCAILYDGTFEPKEFHVNPEKFFPATKEQRDTLFAKMKDAGYTFDFEKKELKLLITNGGDFESENCEQKSAWSEEDEQKLGNAIFACINTYGKNSDSAVWLKSLKQRIMEL